MLISIGDIDTDRSVALQWFVSVLSVCSVLEGFVSVSVFSVFSVFSVRSVGDIGTNRFFVLEVLKVSSRSIV